MSIPADSARLMVCEGGIEATKTLTRVSEAEWVAAAPRGEGPPFLEPFVYTLSYKFQASSPLVGEYVRFVRSESG
jgi:hypothetical protein